MRTVEKQCLSMKTVLTLDSRSDADDLRTRDYGESWEDRYDGCSSLTAL